MLDTSSVSEQSKNGTSVLPDWVDKFGSILRVVAFCFPSLAAKFMAMIWFKPFMPKPKQHVLDWQQSAQQKIDLKVGQAFLFYNNISSYEEQPLVVCVHGWRGRAHQMRRFIPVLLERGFRVLMVNLPAHSGQGKNYTHIYECADVLKEIQVQLGSIDSIIAHSFGSPATILALNEDFQIRKFTMVAPNLDIEYLLQEYAAAFGLQKLAPKIKQYIKQHCDKKIFLGSWENLTLQTLQHNLKFVEEVEIWHDLLDTEISIEANQTVFQFLFERGRTAKIFEVQGLGHFQILKDQDTVDRICEELVKNVEGKKNPHYLHNVGK